MASSTDGPSFSAALAFVQFEMAPRSSVQDNGAPAGKKPPRVYGYARYSTEGQLESSIDRQIGAIDGLTTRLELPKATMFIDRGISGAHTKRQDLQALLAELEKYPGSILIVESGDRLFRSLPAFADIYQRLHASRTQLFDAHGEIPDIMAPIQAIVAAEERKRINNRLGSGRRRAALEGKAMGPTPFGYRKTPFGRFEPDPETAPLVVELFEERARGRSILELVRKLSSDGVRSPGDNGGWSEPTLARLLMNPIYVGVRRSKFSPNGLIPIPELGIVDLETFSKIQSNKKKNIEYHQGRKNYELRGNRERYLLSGRVACPSCGTSMRHRHGRFRCESRRQGWGCSSSTGFWAVGLELRVLEGIAEIVGEAFQDVYAGLLETAFVKENQRIEAQRRELTRQLEEVTREHENGLNFAFKHAGVMREIEERLAASFDRIEELRNALACLPSSRALVTLEETSLATLAQDLESLRDRMPLRFSNPDDRDMLLMIQRLVERVHPSVGSDGGICVRIVYELGPAFGIASHKIERSFTYGASEDSGGINARKRASAIHAVRKEELTLSDAEYASIDRDPRIVLALPNQTNRRIILDTLVISASCATSVGKASDVLSLPVVAIRDQLAFRRNVAACTALAEALAELRPDRKHDFSRLAVKQKTERYLRSRCEAVGHPFLSLSVCSYREAAGGYGLTDQEWEVVIGRVTDRFGSPSTRSTLRSDIGHIIHAIAEDCPFNDIPLLKSSGAVDLRVRRMIRSGVFSEITRSLLLFERKTLDVEAEIPDVPVMNYAPRGTGSRSRKTNTGII